MHSKVLTTYRFRGCPSPFTRPKRTGTNPVLFFVPSLAVNLLAGGVLLFLFATRAGLHLVFDLRCFFRLLWRSAVDTRLRGLLLRSLLVFDGRALLLFGWVDRGLRVRGAAQNGEGRARAAGCLRRFIAAPDHTGEGLTPGELDAGDADQAYHRRHQPGQNAREQHFTPLGGREIPEETG